jgi:hypothetical protein
MWSSGSQPVVVDFARICRWLGLSSRDWPPDHYALLGLTPGEQDPAHLEVQVQDRLRIVRSYQLSHPELATMAMNRLAEAFACLSDPVAKCTYDRNHGIVPSSSPQSTKPVEPSHSPEDRLSHDTDGTGIPTVVIWQNQPPPIRGTEASGTNGAIASNAPTEAIGSKVSEPAPPEPQPSLSAVPEPADPVLAAAQKTWRAFRGQWSQSALQQRIDSTRSLSRTWLQLARYVAVAGRKLRPDARKPFTALLTRVDRLRDEVPQLLGEPGLPGYRLAILARDEDPVRAFQELGPEERELLAQDWKTSAKLLSAHIRFLEAEWHKIHRAGILSRSLHPIKVFVIRRSNWVFASLAFLAVLFVLLALLQR